MWGRLWFLVVSMLVLVAGGACTSLLGDFPSAGETDAGHHGEGGAPDAAPDHAKDHGTPTDAPGDGAAEASQQDAPADSTEESPVTYTLKVSLNGGGSGTVKSVPAGIDCPGTCTLAVASGDKVTLTAVQDSGSLFTGWTGACTGTGSCAVTVTAPSSVTASFTPHTPTTWDPSWSLAGVSYTNGNLSITSTSTTLTTNVRTTIGKSSGSYYWEITVTAGTATSDFGGIGLAGSDMPNSANYIGGTASSLGFGYGKNYEYFLTWVGTTVASGNPPANSGIATGVIYMFALDFSSGSFWAGQNGTWYNSGDPAIGSNAAVTGIIGTVYPAITFYEVSTNAFTANFGDSAFSYPAPTGFTPGFY